MSEAPVSPAVVWEVINGYAAYQGLVAALELGLVDALAACGPDGATAAELAGAVGAADADHVAVLADLLVSIGLLDADGRRYLLTPAAARFLVSSSPAQMRDLVRLSPGPQQAWQQLAETLRSGRPSTRVTDDPAAYLAPLVEATAPTQRAVATATAVFLDAAGRLPAAPLVVDLGAGSAAWSIALLAARPEARAVAVDLPGVAQTTRRLAADLGARVDVVEGDYLTVGLPDRADVVVLGHVLRAEPPARARELLHRAFAVAGPDAVVVVTDYPRPAPPTDVETDRAATLAAARHELTLALTMLASTDGAGVTVDQLSAWAAEAGWHVSDRLEPLPRQYVFLLRPDGAARSDRPARTD